MRLHRIPRRHFLSGNDPDYDPDEAPHGYCECGCPLDRLDNGTTECPRCEAAITAAEDAREWR